MAGSHNVQLIDQIAGLSYYMKNWLKSLQCNFKPANYSARLDYIQTGCQKNCHKLAQNARRTNSQPVMEPFFYLYPLLKATNIITSQFSTY